MLRLLVPDQTNSSRGSPRLESGLCQPETARLPHGARLSSFPLSSATAVTPPAPPARNLGIFNNYGHYSLQREQTPGVSAHRSRMLGRLTLATPAAMPAPGLEQRRTRAADRCKLATIVRHDRGLALDKWRRTVWSRAGEQS